MFLKILCVLCEVNVKFVKKMKFLEIFKSPGLPATLFDKEGYALSVVKTHFIKGGCFAK